MTEQTPSTSPETVPDLLRLLGSTTVSATCQKRSVNTWLNHNAPCRSLNLSLRANGFGNLLDPVSERRGPICATHAF